MNIKWPAHLLPLQSQWFSSDKFSSNRLTLVSILLKSSRIRYLTFQRFARTFHNHLIKACFYCKVLKILFCISFPISEFSGTLFFSSPLLLYNLEWLIPESFPVLSCNWEFAKSICWWEFSNNPYKIWISIKICKTWPFSFEPESSKVPCI